MVSESLTARSAERTLYILDVFLAQEEPLSLSEVSRMLEMPKSTVHRLLTQLVNSGYLDRADNCYVPSLKTFRIGNRHPALSRTGLRAMAAVPLAGLVQQLGLVASLGVLSGNEVVCIDQVQGPRTRQPPLRISDTAPAMTTALGKAMVAFLPPPEGHRYATIRLVRLTGRSIVAPGIASRHLARVRVQGYAVDQEETCPGWVCVGAPVFGPEHQPVGAISVSGPSSRLQVHRAVSMVESAARMASRNLVELV